ncbi:hypothetical protein [Enterovibrio norvegicus]|uniref:hypothetical protein n=1 Tax=Enterovibrio norvegicus TaxID=188144 RepID=UPI000C84E0CB|nr:hypothetical protein [Enterovibrio norvegicus]PML78520.1 hypothetical protein BCT69_03590 [Enterovibrio norvegicus]
MAARFRENGYLDPFSNIIIESDGFSPIAVDHIVPVKTMINMPGFKDLTPDQMKYIVQDKMEIGNLQPLPQYLNASKGFQLDWTIYKKMDRPLDSIYSRNLEELQSIRMEQIQRQIDIFRLVNKYGDM